MTDEELLEIAYDILREMYDEAEPSADFDDIRLNPDDYPDDWYAQHYLPGDKQQEILDKHLAEHNLNDGEERQVTMTCILHYGPASTPPEEQAA